MNILIYSPPPRDSQPIAKMFRQHGAQVECCETSADCQAMTNRSAYDCVIYLHCIDPKTPRDFFEVWKAEGTSSCFALLTQNQSSLERGRGLEIGMDIYQIEPYSYCDLLVELTAQRLRQAMHCRSSFSSLYFRVDVLAQTIMFRDRLLMLSKTEFSLLHCLIRRRGTVLSRVQLWEEVWPGREYPVGNAIDVHIGRLRRKLEPLELILTVHGIGYRMRADV